jgi:hypothetical protein
VKFVLHEKYFEEPFFVSIGEADGGHSPSHPRLALGRGLAHRDGLQGRVPVFLYQMFRLGEISLQGQDSCNGSYSRLKYLESAIRPAVYTVLVEKAGLFRKKPGILAIINIGVGKLIKSFYEKQGLKNLLGVSSFCKSRTCFNTPEMPVFETKKCEQATINPRKLEDTWVCL